MRRDDWSGSILDCSCWPDDYSHALLSRFPNCTIAFVSAPDISTTGFSVFITLEKRSLGKGKMGRWGSFPGIPLPGLVVLGCMMGMIVDIVSMIVV